MDSPESSSLKVAIIGCGRMGGLTTDRTRNSVPPIWLPLSHAESAESIDALQLVAMCDASPEQLSAVLGVYTHVQGFSDYRDMLQEIQPDIVGIATRTEGRCQIIHDCANNGVKGIHAEKPMARNLTECNYAIDAMRNNDTGFTFGAVRRYMAPYILARNIIESGELGALKQIIIEHGSDMLLWGHTHCVDLAFFFSGNLDVRRIQSRLKIDANDVTEHLIDSDPFLEMAYIEFDNDVSAIITNSSGLNTKLSCEKGTIVIKADGTSVEIHKKCEGRPYELEIEQLEFDDTMSGTKQAFLNLVDYINESAFTGISLNEVELIHRVIYGIVYSELSGGKAVSLGDVPEDLCITGRFGDLYA